MKRSDPPNAGHAAIDLLRRWQAHELGGVASSNTLFAVFGVASPAGRFADKFTYNNPPYPAWLADIAYDHGVEVPPRPEGLPRDHPHSPGAAAMVEHGLSRGGGRRDGIVRVLPGKNRSPQRDQGRCGGQQPAHAGAASPWRMRGTARAARWFSHPDAPGRMTASGMPRCYPPRTGAKCRH
jgi:hypothetical protein